MVSNLKLAPNFQLKELFVSRDHPAVAAQLLQRCTNYQIHLGFNLAQDAQRMRDHIQTEESDGRKLIITSCYRDDKLNKLTTGSAGKSLHMQMLAFDFKTDDPHDLYRIYTYITEWAEFDYSECFLYRTEDGIETNIHYARQTVGYTEKRHGIVVRLANGKTVRLEDYENGTHTKR